MKEIATSLASRYVNIQERISKACQVRAESALTRFPAGEPCTLIAVSKKQPIGSIEELYRLGHRDFGENYVQELCEKAIELQKRGCSEIRWHFIGHLQSKKVKALLPFVSSIHTLDSEKLALEVKKRWLDLGLPRKLPVFIETNIDNEPTKSGFSPSLVPDFARKVHEMEGLSLQGLMCIPAVEGDARSGFKRLFDLEQKCHPYTLGMLSMGMSSDFEIAIQEGATHVRVGSDLFGPRTFNS